MVTVLLVDSLLSIFILDLKIQMLIAHRFFHDMCNSDGNSCLINTEAFVLPSCLWELGPNLDAGPSWIK